MTNWAKLRVLDLKDELKRRGLPCHGLKNELIARLNEAENETDNEPAEIDEDPKSPSADDNPTATDSTPKETEAEESEIAVAITPEDASSQKEDEDAASTRNEQGDARLEVESRFETTDNGVPVDARSSSTVEADPKLAGLAEEPMDDAAKETDNSKKPSVLGTQDVSGASVSEVRESQKRKRRSLSPPPTEEAVVRKRTRPDDEAINGFAPRVILPEDQENNQVGTTSEKMQEDGQPGGSPPTSNAHDNRDIKELPLAEPQDHMDIEKEPLPPVHPATSALYIKNFMRPLRPIDVQTHLVDLATPPGVPLDNKIIVNFFLDQIRTHAFAVFKTPSAALRVRTALHDRVWPNESNRKPLWVDFVPPEQVQDWIDKEESSGRRSGARWEVIYEDGPNGEIEAHLESGVASLSRASNRPPPNPLANPGDAIPSAPRGYHDTDGPPTGPRGPRPGPGPGPRPASHAPRGDSQRTKAHPVIHYQPVSEDLARRRIENMRSYYTSDRDRDFGPEINRYSFENGDSFVDRGKEIFEGIRPPHRERAVERERRGFGGGGGGRRRRGGRGFRPRSDRYLPGAGSNRDNRRPRFNDGEGQGRGPPRNDNDRGRRY